MESRQKNVEKILSEKELSQKSVGFIIDFRICSDTFLYVVSAILSLSVVLCRDITEKTGNKKRIH
jgi:hypothetical protein